MRAEYQSGLKFNLTWGGHEVSPQIPLPRAYPTASGWGIQKIIVNIVDTKLRLLGIDMSKKKKDKKSTVKKIAKAQHRKKQKRKLRLIKAKSKPEHKSVVHPPMAEVDAPPGFRAVSMSQAVMEYSKSIFDLNDSESIDDMNQALQLTSLIWNYGIAIESGNVEKKMTKEILDMIQPIWHVPFCIVFYPSKMTINVMSRWKLPRHNRRSAW